MKHPDAAFPDYGSDKIARMSPSNPPESTSGPIALFGREWAAAWRAELAATDDWRRVSGGWCGSLIFEVTAQGDQTSRAIRMDLDGEGCRDARQASDEDLAAADYRLAASAATWARLLDGSLDPMWAAMSGKLRFSSGAEAGAMPSQTAARVIVEAARRVAAKTPPTSES